MSVNRVPPPSDGPWRIGPPGTPRDHRPPPAGSAAEDAVNGAFAVLAVAAALGRCAAESAAAAGVELGPRLVARLSLNRVGGGRPAGTGTGSWRVSVSAFA